MKITKLNSASAVGFYFMLMSFASADTAPQDPSFHEVYGVTSWREVVPEKAAEYKNYRLIVLSNASYSDDEKATKVAKKYSDIREAVKNIRTASYSSVSELIGIGNSATKGSSGGSPKEVDAKCAGSRKPNMYTTASWARGAYRSGDADPDPSIFFSNGNTVAPKDIVIEDGARVCAIALKQSGKGRKYSYSEATFRIRPTEIGKMVDGELPAIMFAISNTPI